MSLRWGFISLRTRFMALAVVLTLLASAVWGSWAWDRERQFLHARLSGEARMLAQAMTIPIISAILYEELGIIAEGGLLDNFVAEIMSNHKLYPLYAIVVDPEGRVLAHNRLVEYGRSLDDDLCLLALNANDILETPFVVGREHAVEIAAPLAMGGKSWGALRIGVSQEPLRQELKRLAWHISMFAIVFSIGALIVFALVGQRLASPLMVLARRMEEADQQAVLQEHWNFRRDEIGLLQKSFYRMIERLRQSEEERQSSVARMLENERLATVGKIVSGVAHEINNPLAGIQGALYHMAQKGGQEIGRYAGLAEQGVERISKIVNQLLDLSRAARVELEEMDSRILFEDITLFARMALKTKQVFLQANDRCPPMLLCLDRDKIHQVILNLLLNAADAVGPGQTVLLEACLDDSWYCLQVQDEGPGIPTAIVGKIFDPFFTTKESGKGSGMGLAISRSIAESHGGTLEVSTVKDHGSTFTLRIPLQPPKRLLHGT